MRNGRSRFNGYNEEISRVKKTNHPCLDGCQSYLHLLPTVLSNVTTKDVIRRSYRWDHHQAFPLDR
jgi:hypothetical protein